MTQSKCNLYNTQLSYLFMTTKLPEYDLQPWKTLKRN